MSSTGAGDARPGPERIAASVPARISGALFLGAAAFQVALAAGMPWGELAWGGAHPGVLPPAWRWGSAGNALVLGGLGAALGGAVRTNPARRRLLGGALVFSAVAVVANSATPSPAERALWVPFALSQIALLVGARRAESRVPAEGPERGIQVNAR